MPHLITSQQARLLTEEIEKLVGPIFEKHGFEAPSTKTTYGDRYAVKFESTPFEEGAGGVNLNSPEAKAYVMEARYSDGKLDPEALGREFTVRGETYIFLGSAPRRPKYPYSAKRQRDGKVFKFTREIERHLAKAEA
jgi:hypothetical protein